MDRADAPEETWSGAGLICPYCKHLHRDAYEYVTESGHETECHSCSKPFLCRSNIRVTYYGRPSPP